MEFHHGKPKKVLRWSPLWKERVFRRWNKVSWSGESMGCRGGMGMWLVWGLGSFTGTLKLLV